MTNVKDGAPWICSATMMRRRSSTTWGARARKIFPEQATSRDGLEGWPHDWSVKSSPTQRGFSDTQWVGVVPVFRQTGARAAVSGATSSGGAAAYGPDQEVL